VNHTLATSGAPPARGADAGRYQAAETPARDTPRDPPRGIRREVLRAGYAEGRLSRGLVVPGRPAARCPLSTPLNALCPTIPGAGGGLVG
jgi:hypothetical protein